MRVATGRTFQANQMSGAASATSAQFMALTANATAPADADTSLVGEIATAGGGLIRKVSAFGFTPGANSYTLTATFTANGADVVPVTVNKMGVFNQLAVGGTMVFESAITPATLNASGDQLTITDTVALV